MPNCPACKSPLPATSLICPSCGAPLDAPDRERPTPPADAATIDAGAPARPSSLAVPEGRFVPGAMVGGRYRIVGLLGRGGMGEVYRADDLKLGQPVALKFLPTAFENDPARLERFLAEVRTARQVTHANVCRVFDIGEVDGRHFLTMEYVDGEDLASLLRRIGRLPQERAVVVARQICAGLAAAHERGILHRDLKPANVMLDGRGQVRLTDFGLAALADGIAGHDVASGTPGYMAPEQLAGREVTVRSDVYALGLVLYELFTGQAAFQAATVAELRDLQEHSNPSNLTTHVRELDPAVERAVLRCLERDPAARPAGALAVAAALPGGDPLAAALAAGETPSPELLAQAGEREGMRAGRATLLAGAALAAILAVTHWAGSVSLMHFLPLDKRPEVLMDRARGVLDELGFDEPVYSRPVDQAWGMLFWSEVVAAVGEADSSASRWEGLRQRPDAASFWYRQSPRPMLPEPQSKPIFSRGAVELVSPWPSTPGETYVVLDLAGNLRRLEIMPKRYSTREPAEPDWQALFALAGLDTARFTPDRPRYQRFMAPDLRRAWVGTRSDAPDVRLRVEAGAFEGRPILFNVAPLRSMESLSGAPEPARATLGQVAANSLAPLLILAIVAVAIRMSTQNMGQGRTDSRGSARFAVAMFVLYTVATALSSHALTTREAANEIWPILAGGCFFALISWGSYSAAEPLGRRVWPQMFVSSSRLLSGSRVRWRDPLIGHSVLVGVLSGAVLFALRAPLRWHLRSWLEGTPAGPLSGDLTILRGQRLALGLILDQALLIGYVLIFVAALVVIRYLVKRRLPTLILTFVAWLLIAGDLQPPDLPIALAGTAVMMFVLLRWGVVALAVSNITASICWLARSADWSAWHAEGPLLALAALVLLTLFGAWAAVGDRKPTPPR
jgi:hypothetical protein